MFLIRSILKKSLFYCNIPKKKKVESIILKIKTANNMRMPKFLLSVLVATEIFLNTVFVVNSWTPVIQLHKRSHQGTLRHPFSRISTTTISNPHPTPKTTQFQQAATDYSDIESSTSSASLLLPPAISVDHLSCTHNGGETWQVKDASFVLPQGAKAALIGINGSGKSTLLRILAESTCGQDSFVDTTSEGMKYTGTVSSPKTLKVAFVEQVRTRILLLYRM